MAAIFVVKFHNLHRNFGGVYLKPLWSEMMGFMTTRCLFNYRRLRAVTTQSYLFHRSIKAHANTASNLMVIPVATTKAIPSLQLANQRLLHSDSTRGIDAAWVGKNVEVVHGGKKTILNNLWLRDHCRCDLCYDTKMSAKNNDMSKLDFSVTPKTVSTVKHQLNIEWSDGHKSIHYLDSIIDAMVTDSDQSESRKLMQLWDTSTILSNMPQSVEYTQYLTDDTLLKTTLQNLATFGIAFVKNVPATVEDTQKVAKRIGSLQEFLWGNHLLLSSGYTWDKGFTANRFDIHTDIAYLNNVSGAIVFHCLSHEGDGGKTILVDGFNIAEKLKQNHPEYYDILTSVPVRHDKILPDKMIHSSGESPIFELCRVTGEVKSVRFNLTSSIKHYDNDKLNLFYEALVTFIKEVTSPENELQIKLHPGVVCFVDNWRLLHGRTAFTGLRKMLSLYLSRDDLCSRYRTVLNLKI
ncbi:trimethyllysine dioxygenase, mitochondrial-like [Glandiceps talaboti]